MGRGGSQAAAASWDHRQGWSQEGPRQEARQDPSTCRGRNGAHLSRRFQECHLSACGWARGGLPRKEGVHMDLQMCSVGQIILI